MIFIRNGEFKGKKLVNEINDKITRPSKDIVKLGLFNILRANNKLNDSSFLDLFAGTGQIGIEAISLKMKEVVFNDLNKTAYLNILKNINSLKLNNDTKIKVYNLDYLALINQEKDHLFDVIFLDPPYKMKIDNQLIDSLFINHLANKDSFIFIESDKELDNSLLFTYNIKEYKYGRSKLYLLKKND